MPPRQALEIARKQGLDLVEVAATAAPPVCRLLDYGKYKYEQEKKEREAKRSQRAALLRQVRLRPRIDKHDFEAKTRTVKKLLGEGDKVKITVWFRGREITHPELGWRLLQRMGEALKDVATTDGQPSLDGKSMSMTVSPAPVKKVKQEVGGSSA